MAPLSSFSVAGTVVEVGSRKRLRFDDSEVYLEQIGQMATGVSVVVTVAEEKPHRAKTWEQIKYLWAVPIPLVADHCGMTDQQAKTALLGECFGYLDGFNGQKVPGEPSLSALSVEKATHLISWLLDWCPAEMEIIIPPPDRAWRQHAEQIRKDRRRAA